VAARQAQPSLGRTSHSSSLARYRKRQFLWGNRLSYLQRFPDGQQRLLYDFERADECRLPHDRLLRVRTRRLEAFSEAHTKSRFTLRVGSACTRNQREDGNIRSCVLPAADGGLRWPSGGTADSGLGAAWQRNIEVRCRRIA